MYNILICDDEKDIVNALKIYLAEENYNLFTASNGQEALDVIASEEIQLVLLDIMMPIMDGMEAMMKIREKSNIPIILLTAKSEDMDKVLGLDSGADDYITKPFNPTEVLARVKSQLRRYMFLGSVSANESVYKVGGIVLDDNTKKVEVDAEEVKLTPTQFDILKLFMKNTGKVFSPEEIYKHIWKDLPFDSQNVIAVHIRHVREKIEINPGDPRYIKVVWGQGYKMEG